jgi:glycerate dehydrogenase
MGNIVITDGYTLNPGDLSWEALHQFGKVMNYDRTAKGEVMERCKDAMIIITNKTPVSADVIREASNLKGIAVTATGYNIVDINAARERGIAVSNVPGYGTDSVAQHTFAFILEFANGVGVNSQSVADGDWAGSRDFCYTKTPLIEIAGKTLGIVGYGTIGRRVAEIARVFGMNVLYNSPSLMGRDPGAVDVETIFRESDFVTLHCPLTTENQGFVNIDLLARMKSTSFLINTARGPLINENDLRDALQRGKLAGAALDVLSSEPPPADHPLIGLPNCIITPHNAWCSFEARQRIMETTVDNVRAMLNGEPVNVVNRG